MVTTRIDIVGYTASGSAWCATCTQEWAGWGGWAPWGAQAEVLSPIYAGDPAEGEDLFCIGCGELLLTAEPSLRIAAADWELGTSGSG